MTAGIKKDAVLHSMRFYVQGIYDATWGWAGQSNYRPGVYHHWRGSTHAYWRGSTPAYISPQLEVDVLVNSQNTTKTQQNL
jgi:hypothetical protein